MEEKLFGNSKISCASLCMYLPYYTFHLGQTSEICKNILSDLQSSRNFMLGCIQGKYKVEQLISEAFRIQPAIRLDLLEPSVWLQ